MVSRPFDSVSVALDKANTNVSHCFIVDVNTQTDVERPIRVTYSSRKPIPLDVRAMTSLPIHIGAPKPNWRTLADTGQVYVVEMDVRDWIALPSHPRQRDTKRQAAKPHFELARRASDAVRESLRWVVAAEFRGQIWKVQGHARALLWDTGGLENPLVVYATVFRCGSFQALLDLHSSFDSKDAAGSAVDRVLGAYREHGLDLKSKRLRYGMIADALWLALRGVARKTDSGAQSAADDLDVYEAVGAFKNELLMLDSVNPTPEIFQTGVVAAALLGLALNPEGLHFFDAVAKNEGCKKGPLLDPVQATRQLIEGIKKSKSSWVRSSHEDLCGKVLRAYFTWCRGPSADGYWSPSIQESESVSHIAHRVKTLKDGNELPR